MPSLFLVKPDVLLIIAIATIAALLVALAALAVVHPGR